MIKANLTKREIAQKTARVAHLKEFIAGNNPHAMENVAAGFFASAADLYDQMSAHCRELRTLHEDLQQLRFDLERIRSEQAELHLCGSASGAVLNSPAAA